MEIIKGLYLNTDKIIIGKEYKIKIIPVKNVIQAISVITK